MAVHTASIAVLPSAQPHPVPLTVLTVNTHKGFDAFGRRFVLHELRDAIRAVGADLVFLQEVHERPSAELPHERIRDGQDGCQDGQSRRVAGRTIRVFVPRGGHKFNFPNRSLRKACG